MNSRSWMILSLLGLGALACTRTNKSLTSDSDRGRVLAAVADHAILPIYQNLVTESERLEQSTAAYATDSSTASLAGAQEAWRQTMSVWEEAELFQLGPAGVSGARIGGQDLRDEIYSWPTTNTCRIDQDVVSNQFGAPEFFDGKLVNSYGLDALEYLLFNSNPSHTCPPQLPISQGQWAALSDGEKVQLRAGLAHAVSKKLRVDAERLLEAWKEGKGGFVLEFKNAGARTSSYRSTKEGMDQLFAALFYLELVTKDRKLALPSGLAPDCVTSVCPEALEFQYARFSKEAVKSNLIGFQKGFTAGDGYGFEDLLRDFNAGDLAADMGRDTEAAIASVNALDEDFSTMLQVDPGKVKTVHDAVKKVTDQLKSQFISVLNLSVPQEGAADND